MTFSDLENIAYNHNYGNLIAEVAKKHNQKCYYYYYVPEKPCLIFDEYCYVYPNQIDGGYTYKYIRQHPQDDPEKIVHIAHLISSGYIGLPIMFNTVVDGKFLVLLNKRDDDLAKKIFQEYRRTELEKFVEQTNKEIDALSDAIVSEKFYPAN